MKYNLPEYIHDHRKYITSVLAYEAVTKIIMDLEKCCYEKATGIGLGEELPTIRDSLANANRGARPKKRDHPKTAGEGTKKVEKKAKDTNKTKNNG